MVWKPSNVRTYVHSVCIMAKLNIIHHSMFRYAVCN